MIADYNMEYIARHNEVHGVPQISEFYLKPIDCIQIDCGRTMHKGIHCNLNLLGSFCAMVLWHNIIGESK